jgi:uncharacterized protein (TIRG00374 family)
VAVFVGVLPHIANLDRVWSAIRSLTWRQELVLGVLAVWNLVTYWPMLMAVMPGLSFGQAAVVCQSSTTVAMTVPGGGALAVGVSYAMYTSWGFTRSQVAASAATTFLANMSFKLLLPATSLLLVIMEGDQSAGLVGSALLGVSIFIAAALIVAVALRSESFARRIGALAGRLLSSIRRAMGRPDVTGLDEAALRFRAQILGLLRRRWLPLATFEILSQLSVFAVMLASVRFVGDGSLAVSAAEALAVFAFVRLASAVPLIPGNVGLAELGYIGGLVLAGAGRTDAVAAVLVFRFLTYFAQIPIGGITYLIWKRHHGWRASPRVRPYDEEPGPDEDDERGTEGEPRKIEDGPAGDREVHPIPSP